ncbi:hypothetical protein Salat_2527400 [Sesamum alatum]|uniref:Uncharacterized protein n=1 Tax=Sesamum alatum TaxID=300844 RepID=A0AAE2CCE6_9LAMI|nr:hypothetical protein Salat_2527400 [Sesamum alatum]
MIHYVLPVVSIDPSLEIFFGVFTPRLCSGECLREKPSSYGSWKSCYFFVREGRLTDAGLFEHGFKAKALLKIKLLVVARLHLAVDDYDGPESLYSHLHVPSSSRVRSEFETPDAPRAIPMRSASPHPSLLYSTDPVHEPPIIEVVTSPEMEDVPLSSLPPSPPPLVTPTEVGQAIFKRPRIAEAPSEGTLLEEGVFQPVSFLASVVYPQFNPKVGLSYMCKTVRRADVDSLSVCPMEGLGHLLLSHTAMTPAITLAMAEKYEKIQKKS